MKKIILYTMSIVAFFNVVSMQHNRVFVASSDGYITVQPATTSVLPNQASEKRLCGQEFFYDSFLSGLPDEKVEKYWEALQNLYNGIALFDNVGNSENVTEGEKMLCCGFSVLSSLPNTILTSYEDGLAGVISFYFIIGAIRESKPLLNTIVEKIGWNPDEEISLTALDEFLRGVKVTSPLKGTDDGVSPLLLMCHRKQQNAIDMLVALGADTHKKSHQGLTPAFLATKLGLKI